MPSHNIDRSEAFDRDRTPGQGALRVCGRGRAISLAGWFYIGTAVFWLGVFLAFRAFL